MRGSRTVSFSDEIRARAPLFTTGGPLLRGRLQPPPGRRGHRSAWPSISNYAVPRAALRCS